MPPAKFHFFPLFPLFLFFQKPPICDMLCYLFSSLKPKKKPAAGGCPETAPPGQLETLKYRMPAAIYNKPDAASNTCILRVATLAMAEVATQKRRGATR